MTVLCPADLDYAAWALGEPLDPEREAWRARRKRFVRDPRSGLIVPARRIGGASNYTSTVSEVLYASSIAGAALVSFTSEAMLYAATQPEAWLPAGFFDPTYGTNKAIRITARGIYSTTVTPTFTIGLRIGAAGVVTGQILGSSLAVTAQSSVTNLVWELECDITGEVPVLASAHNQAVLLCLGMLSGVSTGSNGFSNASAIGTQTPTTALTLTAADAANYLVPSATCGTLSASNKWQMLHMLVFGLN